MWTLTCVPLPVSSGGGEPGPPGFANSQSFQSNSFNSSSPVRSTTSLPLPLAALTTLTLVVRDVLTMLTVGEVLTELTRGC